nr:unnamed protein product [Spirometra erinaceieuropaei]
MSFVSVLTLYLLAFVSAILAFKVESSRNRFTEVATVSDYLNMCLYRPHHKSAPSPEPDLEDCAEWRNLSCCTKEKSEGYLEKAVGGFDLHHCGQPLPLECSRMFHREYCHAYCSPYLGPWLVKTHSKRFPERAYGMPLCQSDCDAWYSACKKGLTCARNWRAGGFNWTTGTNQCHAGLTCQPIELVFPSAKDFCEQVWDGSWKVIPDSKHVWLDEEPQCLHIIHRDVSGHNKRVAEHYAQRILDHIADIAAKGIGN